MVSTTALRSGRLTSALRWDSPAVHFLLSTNLSEIELMLGSIALGLGPPLSPLQLLWINLVTDVFPALALAMEPAEPDVMRHPPRDPHEPMIRRADLSLYAREATLIALGALGSYGFGLLRHGPGARAGTLGFMTLALGQLAHACRCRSDTRALFTSRKLPRNPILELAIGGTATVQLGALFIPQLRSALGLALLDPIDLVVTAAGSALPLIATDLTRAQAPPRFSHEASSYRRAALPHRRGPIEGAIPCSQE